MNKIIIVNGQKMAEIINTIATLSQVEDSLEINVLDLDNYSVDEIITLCNIIKTVKGKVKINIFNDIDLKQLIIFTTAGINDREMDRNWQIKLNRENLTDNDVDKVANFLSQPSNTKYCVEDLKEDIENGKMLDEKNIKRLKICKNFTGEKPRIKKSKQMASKPVINKDRVDNPKDPIKTRKGKKNRKKGEDEKSSMKVVKTISLENENHKE